MRHDLEHVAHAFALENRPLIDLGQPVVDDVGQGTAVSPQLDMTIRLFGDLDVSERQVPMRGPALEQEPHFSYCSVRLCDTFGRQEMRRRSSSLCRGRCASTSLRAGLPQRVLKLGMEARA